LKSRKNSVDLNFLLKSKKKFSWSLTFSWNQEKIQLTFNFLLKSRKHSRKLKINWIFSWFQEKVEDQLNFFLISRESWRSAEFLLDIKRKLKINWIFSWFKSWSLKLSLEIKKKFSWSLTLPLNQEKIQLIFNFLLKSRKNSIDL
jgi:hypothetical protein